MLGSRLLRNLITVIAAVLMGWIGLVLPVSSVGVAAEVASIQTYVYDGNHPAADLHHTAAERGPPASVQHTATDTASVAVGHWSRGASASIRAV